MANGKKKEQARVYVSQADVPACLLEQALRIPEAIADNYARKPTAPLRVASALDMQPLSGSFRSLCGAAIAYGLTAGGYNSVEIALTPLASRILRPTKEGDDLLAKREAFLRPRILGEFLQKYHGAKFPRDEIARHVLEDMGVPRDRTERVLDIIKSGAASLGLLEEIKGNLYVHLEAGGLPTPEDAQGEVSDVTIEPNREEKPAQHAAGSNGEPSQQPPKGTGGDRASVLRRVFISHGKNRAFLEPLKKLLGFADLDPVTSVERESVSIPIPEKVMNDMRSCGAAIIHVHDEQRLIAPDATEHTVLNENVLIEIGAAMALYGKRYILLVKEGLHTPSNLQGLYQVRYSGEGLDGDMTIRLIEAISDLKKQPLPSVWLDGE